VNQALPPLLDAKQLQAELGVTRAAAEAIMRQLEVVQFEGLRKVYVRRQDVAALIEQSTFEGSGSNCLVPAQQVFYWFPGDHCAGPVRGVICGHA
jgi:hypothetical protein